MLSRAEDPADTVRPDQEVRATPCETFEPDEQSAPLVLASPHSGRRYPLGFVKASRLDPVMLRRSEDAFIDEIFADAPGLGAPFLIAHFPRAYVDPNREPFELDGHMFDHPLPTWVNSVSARVAGGLGTIARIVTSGEEIYDGKLDFKEVLARIESFHAPYHQALESLLERTLVKFGGYLLVDCHSMPSKGGAMDEDTTLARFDVILGDCHGGSSGRSISEFAQEALEAEGFRVNRNYPYAGGYTTRHYGRPKEGRHAIQFEVNRKLYMDEDAVARGPGLDALRRRMGRVVKALAAIDPEMLKA